MTLLRSLRSRWRARAALIAVVALFSSVFGLQLVNISSAAAGVTDTGTGSSYAAVAINNWVGQTANLYGLSINFQTQSSVLGLDAFGAGQVDFAASEIGYNANQAQPVPAPGSYQYLPDVAGATCIMYNVQSTTQQRVTGLQLNATALLGIFDGTITTWDQLSSIGQNASLGLPNTQIIPVVRTDASGDNYLFSDYFNTLLPGPWVQFQQAVLGSNYPAGPSAIWPSAGQNGQIGNYNLAETQSVNGSDIASNTVAATPSSVTYVETAYALLHGIPCAAVQNGDGNYVQPSSLADALALTKDQLNADLTQNLSGVYTDNDPADSGAYPISAYSYLVTSVGGGMSVAKAAEMAKFINFLACQGQISAGQLGYSPIPPNLILDDFAAIGRLNGQVAPPSPTGQNCPNPYLTGAAQYVGGPIQLSTGGSGAAAAPAVATGVSGVKQVSAAQASSELKTKEHGGVLAAQGQVLGVALNNSVNKMLGLSGPTLAILATSLTFLAIVLIPPTIGLLRRRRRLNIQSNVEDQS